MPPVLDQLGEKLAEKWVSALALPGLLLVGASACAAVLGQGRALDAGLLIEEAGHWATTVAHWPVVGQVAAVAVTLLVAVAMGTFVRVCSDGAVRVWTGDWPHAGPGSGETCSGRSTGSAATTHRTTATTRNCGRSRTSPPAVTGRGSPHRPGPRTPATGSPGWRAACGASTASTWPPAGPGCGWCCRRRSGRSCGPRGPGSMPRWPDRCGPAATWCSAASGGRPPGGRGARRAGGGRRRVHLRKLAEEVGIALPPGPTWEPRVGLLFSRLFRKGA
ncbi:hypothetical protein SLAV_37910 [Streptomyces lavendulae subsp. lavendulae]|uniref:Uncharacterized protein n=1 Tax=Streptomyces lavendulae subsp. lavendulae TaxID=58340 RepID=A0A2K8PRG3_STRLA|nr:hypothetical protein SLAV_37910 [Streptomyces lavendulae subsp. lavendulae]QUQ59156.1 hypothetical protein SLLC_36050 [Streptomyces lavendulae subsp. lavendulae]